MPNNPPYRRPCRIGARAKFTFCCEDTGSVLVDKYTNTTVVDNWDTSEGAPATIPPYERWTPDLSGGDSCEVHHCVVDGAPCSAWLQPFTENTFSHTDGDQVNFAVANKRGFKNVQARRSWHGAWPWTAAETGCPTNVCDDGTGYQGEQLTPTTVKYLTATYDVHWTWVTIGEPINESVDKTGVRSVNALSGELTSSLITTETFQQDFGSGWVTTYYSSGGAGYDADSTGTHTDDFASGGTTDLDTFDEGACFPTVNPDATGFGNIATIAKIWNDSIDDGTFTGDRLPLMTDPNNYSASATGRLSGDDGSGLPRSVTLTFSRTATVLSWDFTHVASGNTSHYYGSITLSNPNTADTVYSDIKDNLLSLWPLNDDSLYPWRTDVKTAIAPLVTRNELFNVSPLGFNPYAIDDLRSPINDADGNAPFSGSWTPTYDQMGWIDPSVWVFTFADGTQVPVGSNTSTAAATGLLQLFDGSILGAPNPAGYQNYFDFHFLEVRGCCFRPPDDPGFTAWDWYPLGWGIWLADAGGFDGFNTISSCNLPLNATQWNNWFDAVNKPSGAWIFYADKADYFPGDCLPSTEGAHSGAGDAGAFVAQKWAEILETWASQNFARPAGDDKFAYDESRVYCATNVSGSGPDSTWSLIDPSTGAAPTTLDLTAVWGGPSVGGFYAVSDYTAGVVTLGAKQYDVPSNWASKSNGDDATCFGPLRFPTAPSILGRAAVTTTSPGTTFTFTSAQPNFGMEVTSGTPNQEQIDLYDSTMTLLASNVTATRSSLSDSPTQFTITSGQPTAVYIQIHGTPAYYINDADPKGDYVLLEWTSDFRSAGEASRLSGITDCSGTPVSVPTTNRGGGAVTNLFRDFTQTGACIGFNPCGPRVVCISPNGEAFTNGTTYDFPETFEADELYGSKWWGYVQQTMTDLLWQIPHRPCNIKSCARWLMDDSTCKDDVPGLNVCPGDEDYVSDTETPPPIYYYALTPLVEARITIPDNYGLAQDESAPALPSGIQIGWSSPVTHAFGDGDVAFPPPAPGIESDTGRPGNAITPWLIHSNLCTAHAGGCRFNYNPPGCT